MEKFKVNQQLAHAALEQATIQGDANRMTASEEATAAMEEHKELAVKAEEARVNWQGAKSEVDRLTEERAQCAQEVIIPFAFFSILSFSCGPPPPERSQFI